MIVGDWLTIIIAVAGAAAAFLGLKDFIRDKFEHLQDQLHEQKMENISTIHQLKTENIRLSSKLEHVEALMWLFNDQLIDQMKELKKGGSK